MHGYGDMKNFDCGKIFGGALIFLVAGGTLAFSLSLSLSLSLSFGCMIFGYKQFMVMWVLVMRIFWTCDLLLLIFFWHVICYEMMS